MVKAFFPVLFTAGLNDELGLQNELTKSQKNHSVYSNKHFQRKHLFNVFMVSLASSFRKPKSSFKIKVLLLYREKVCSYFEDEWLALFSTFADRRGDL